MVISAVGKEDKTGQRKLRVQKPVGGGEVRQLQSCDLKQEAEVGLIESVTFMQIHKVKELLCGCLERSSPSR